MKKIFILVISVLLVFSFSLIACQKKEAPQKESTVTEPAPEYGEEPKAGGYGEESESGGYGEEPESGGYGEESKAGGY